MNDNDNKRNNVSGDEVDGEYHFIKPEERLYEDAGYVSEDETTDVPRYYAPQEEKKPRKPAEKQGGRTIRTLCACLACALLGGLAGGYLSYNAAVGSLEDESGAVLTTARPVSSDGTGKAYSANEIYTIACSQTVGVSLESSSSGILGQSGSGSVEGTGFVITADGYLLTNYHVIENAVERSYTVRIQFKDGTSYSAAVIGYDVDNDIAVLKIDASDLEAATLGDSGDISVGDEVYTVGHPLGGLDFSMTSGRISALDRSVSTDSDSAAINMFQFDAAINSGNSGGPVYNSSGEVVGIATAKVGDSGVEGLGFAIPINDAVDIANELITNGYVSGKAYMGVNIDSRYSSVYAQYYSMPVGAYVYNVEAGSCAEDCGLAAGDIITELGGDTITSYTDLSNAVKSRKAGENTELVIYRTGTYLTLDITFDESTPQSSNGVSEFGVAAIPAN